MNRTTASILLACLLAVGVGIVWLRLGHDAGGPPPAEPATVAATKPAPTSDRQTVAAIAGARSEVAGAPSGADDGKVTIQDLGLTLVAVAPGSFLMGSDHDDVDERPAHEVVVNAPFWIGQTEVTQAQYEAVVGHNPSLFAGRAAPVDRVSWEDAMVLCQKLTARERGAGRLPATQEYRLPTEAEWEYCARGGTKGQGHRFSGSATVRFVAWHVRNAASKTHPVAQLQANELGLYDMSGNVSEWCYDGWDEPAPADGKGSNFAGTGAASARVTRGGSWNDDAWACRSANRFPVERSLRSFGRGFRIVRTSQMLPYVVPVVAPTAPPTHLCGVLDDSWHIPDPDDELGLTFMQAAPREPVDETSGTPSPAEVEARFLEALRRVSSYYVERRSEMAAELAAANVIVEHAPEGLLRQYHDRVHLLGWTAPKGFYDLLLQAGTTPEQRQQLRLLDVLNYRLAFYGDEQDVASFVADARTVLAEPAEAAEQRSCFPLTDLLSKMVNLDVTRGGPLTDLFVECLNSVQTYRWHRGGRVSLAFLALEAMNGPGVFDPNHDGRLRSREHLRRYRLKNPDDPAQLAAQRAYLAKLAKYLSNRYGWDVSFRAPYLACGEESFGLVPVRDTPQVPIDIWPDGMEGLILRFLRLKYDGPGWDDGMDEMSRADRNFLEQFQKLTGLRVGGQSESHPIALLRRYRKGYAPPFVYMTGTAGIAVADADAGSLRTYLRDDGGMLFADCGSVQWDQSFRAFIKQVLPGEDLEVIPHDDPLFQQPFPLPDGAPPLAHYGGNDALGVKHAGRWVVFYHPGDLNDAWKADRLDGTAIKLGVNIVHYAFVHYLDLSRKYRTK